MNEIEQLKHRLATVADDLQALRNFIAQEGLTETFQKPTEHCDEAFTHLNNIEIACDLSSEESLAWGLFNK
jgi:uncharacterized membrane protein YccC